MTRSAMQRGTSIMSPVRSSVLHILAAAGIPLLLAGCGAANFSLPGKTTTVTPQAVPTLSGRVHGGQQPVALSQVYLYAASTSGYATASTSLLAKTASNVLTDASGNGYVITDSGGNFSITGDYTCPSASTQVYALATAGNPGLPSGSYNPFLSLMAALGPCGSLQSTQFISINELTTVASVWALAPFMAGSTSVATSPANTAGLATAFALVSQLVNSSTGAVGGPALPSGGVLPVAEMNTIADILSACINSQGGLPGDGSLCGTLFASTTLSGGQPPLDTVGAALSMAQNPASNVSTLFALSSANAPFQPALSVAPTDWSIAIRYSPDGLNHPKAVAVDASGNIWIANCGSANCATTGVGSVTELAPTGSVIGTTSAGGLNVPYAIAIDLNGNAWIANYGGNSVTELSPSLTPVAPAYTGGGLNQPNSIAIDASGNAWLTNSGTNAISEFSSAGAALSGSGGTIISGAASPVAIAINPH